MKLKPQQFPSQILIPVFLSLLIIFFMYLRIIYKMGVDWLNDPNYSHGFLIPVISGYLIWKKRAEIHEHLGQPHFLGIILLLFGCLLFLVGNIAGELFTQRISFLFIISAYIFLIGGISLWKFLWFPICYLIFMIPLPYILYDAIAFPLKLFATKFSTIFLQALGVPIYSEGNLIYLPTTTLEVADACSGIRSLISILALSVIIAKIMLSDNIKRILLISLSIPVVIFCNMLRIIITGLLAAKNPKLSQGFFHSFSGEIIFFVGIVFILTFTYFLKNFSRKTIQNKIVKNVSVKQSPSVQSISPNLFWYSSLILLSFFVFNFYCSKVTATSLLQPLTLLPSTINGFTMVSEASLDDDVLSQLGVDDYILRAYKGPKAYTLWLYIGYFEDQKEGTMIHSPKHCYPGGGWYPLSSKIISLKIPAIDKTIRLNEYLLKKGNSKQLVYYWYSSRGRVVANEYIDRFYMILDSIIRHRSDGALVRISGPANNLEEAKRIQKQFIKDLYPVLLKYLPS